MKNTPNVQLLNPKTEELGQFKYLKYCINESLRFGPPAQLTDNYRLLEEVKIDSFTLRKDEQIKFYIYGLHHNPNEWQRHDEFLPERFDPDNKLYLTPGGKERHELSFMPFGLGDRKCIGYKFAEFVVPIIAMNMVHNFDLEFCDEKMND